VASICKLVLSVRKTNPVKKALGVPRYLSAENLLSAAKTGKISWRKISLVIFERHSIVLLFYGIYSLVGKMINDNPAAVDQKSKNAIGSEIEEFQRYISSDKEVCSVLSTNDPDFIKNKSSILTRFIWLGYFRCLFQRYFPKHFTNNQLSLTFIFRHKI